MGMTNKTKAAIEEAANQKYHPVSDHKPHYIAGMKEVVEHPERYDLVSIRPTEKQELYDILCASAANARYYADTDKELHGVIQGLIKKFKP